MVNSKSTAAVEKFLYKRKKYTVEELASLAKTTTKNVKQRISRGWKIKDVVEVPIEGKGRKRSIIESAVVN